MEAEKNSVIYMGLISGPNKADDTCGRTTVTETMDRGFTVIDLTMQHVFHQTVKFRSQIKTKYNCPQRILCTLNYWP
jgi:hypothetical protein